MALDMTLRLAGGIAILDLDGSLEFSPDDSAMRDLLLRVFQNGNEQILLNLERVVNADSGGLGELVAAYAALTRRGGTLKLLRPQPKIVTMLRTTHIDSLFQIHSDERAALASFRPQGPGEADTTSAS